MKKYIAIALVIILCLSLTACTGASVDGYYEYLEGESGRKFTKTGFNEGTFERYYEGEPAPTEAYIRNTNTWELDGDVLLLNYSNNSQSYYKVYDDCLISIPYRDGEPAKHQYIAPKGNRFDYKIDGYVFHKDGTIAQMTEVWDEDDWIYRVVEDPIGSYYKSQNVIYMKYTNGEKYVPLYYIYDGDHIITANHVLVKDTFTRQIGNWFESLIHG